MAPAVDVTVTNNKTHALIGGGAVVRAADDVAVIADANESIPLVAGPCGRHRGHRRRHQRAGANGETSRPSRSGAGGGDALVGANDDTKVTLIDGGLIGLAGIGAGVGVVSITKATTAPIGDRRCHGPWGQQRSTRRHQRRSFGSTPAHGVMSMQVRSETSSTWLLPRGAGFQAAGSVLVDLISSQTKATNNDADVNWNNNGASGARRRRGRQQQATTKTFALAIAGGVVGSAVRSTGNVNNNTAASINTGA